MEEQTSSTVVDEYAEFVANMEASSLEATMGFLMAIHPEHKARIQKLRKELRKHVRSLNDCYEKYQELSVDLNQLPEVVDLNVQSVLKHPLMNKITSLTTKYSTKRRDMFFALLAHSFGTPNKDILWLWNGLDPLDRLRIGKHEKVKIEVVNKAVYTRGPAAWREFEVDIKSL